MSLKNLVTLLQNHSRLKHIIKPYVFEIISIYNHELFFVIKNLQICLEDIHIWNIKNYSNYRFEIFQQNMRTKSFIILL